MKTIKYLSSLCLAMLLFINCSDDDNNLDFVDNVTAPSNISANFTAELNETTGDFGLITITPNAEGAVSYNVSFGDISCNDTSLHFHFVGCSIYWDEC